MRPSLRNDTEIKNLEIKNKVKILGVHFTYDSRGKRKLNFGEIVTSLYSVKKAFNLQEQIVLRLNGQNTSINKAVSKTIYKELRNRVITIPSGSVGLPSI